MGNARQHADRLNRLLEAAEKELIKFEQQENEFCRKDRKERAQPNSNFPWIKAILTELKPATSNDSHVEFLASLCAAGDRPVQ
jgi:hypothetical protein